MDAETETTLASDSSQLETLISSLEQATHMAKKLRKKPTNPTHLKQLHKTIRAAHEQLSLCLNSAVDAGAGEPMQVEEDDGHDEIDDGSVGIKFENSSRDVDKVEERMRENFFIQNSRKRPKRRLSPASVAEGEAERRLREAEDGGGWREVDKLRSLDLIYQFHA